MRWTFLLCFVISSSSLRFDAINCDASSYSISHAFNCLPGDVGEGENCSCSPSPTLSSASISTSCHVASLRSYLPSINFSSPTEIRTYACNELLSRYGSEAINNNARRGKRHEKGSESDSEREKGIVC